MKHLLAASLLIFLNACTGSGADMTISNAPRKDSLPSGVHPGNTLAAIDRSPMDMAYFPADFPILKTSGKTATATPLARVIYSRPHRQGRAIFGTLVPYGHPWRLGANEATEIELFTPATIQEKPVAKGRYILYCIPQPEEWTLVFNSNLFTWGLNPDSTKDVYRFTVPVVKTAQPIEHFTLVFQPAQEGAALVIAWENAEARLPIQFK